MPYTIGLDVGTTSVKAVVVSQDGSAIATASEEYDLSTPKPLWSEQDPAHWWRGSKAVLATLIATSPVPPAEIVAIGLTGQMHGAVFLDDHDQVIRPAILWNDGRTASQCAEITRLVGAEKLIQITGNPALTGFQAPKALWLRENEPDNYARVAKLLLPKDYIRLMLSGDYATDASDAAGTLLLDLASRDWSANILDAIGIPYSWLPEIYEGPEVTGRLRPDIATELGLPVGLPVVAGGGDNAAAAVGTGIIREGIISSSIGTSGVLFAHSDNILLDPGGRLHTFCHAVPGAYHLMAVTLSAGGALQWLRNLLRALPQGDTTLDYTSLVALAQDIPPGADGLLFLPYLSGERTPHLDPLARGAFIGLTVRHTLGHLVRAVLEGVTFSLRDGLSIMQGLGLQIDEIRATGGGARSPLWSQIQADIFKRPIRNLVAEEGPAFGAALLAAVGANLFPDVGSAVATAVKTRQTIPPRSAQFPLYDRLYATYDTLYPALKSAFADLSNT
jgi:xylulokinase